MGVFAPECRYGLYTSPALFPVLQRQNARQMTSKETQTNGGNGGDQGKSGDSGDGRGQSATRRFVFADWRNSGDHDLCIHAEARGPERVPIQPRTGLATAKWVPVDKRAGRTLMCNRLHEGDCVWPWDVPSQGEPVPDPV